MKQINNKTKILIVGLGLIGGSYAKALTKGLQGQGNYPRQQ